MIDWYGCRSCNKYAVCLIRDDEEAIKTIKTADNCKDRDYRINVNMRRTFR